MVRQIKAKKGVRLEQKLETVRRIEAGERQVGVSRLKVCLALRLNMCKSLTSI